MSINTWPGLYAVNRLLSEAFKFRDYTPSTVSKRFISFVKTCFFTGRQGKFGRADC